MHSDKSQLLSPSPQKLQQQQQQKHLRTVTFFSNSQQRMAVERIEIQSQKLDCNLIYPKREFH